MNTDKVVAQIKKLIRYIEERIVLRNIVLAFFILVFGTTIIMQVLRIYTRHNQNLSVPDFQGLTLSDASEMAKDRNLRIVVFDSIYMAESEKGTVVDQHPKAGLKVKKNRKIFLTMNAINPEKVAMPDLVNLTYIQAEAKLESFGLKVGNISYEPNLAIKLILAQRLGGRELLPGDSVVKGARIDLVIGKGLSDEQAAVPNLLGLTLEEARMRALDRFLNVGASVHDQTILTPEDELKAVIFRQRPESGSELTLPLGSEIDVWITLDSTKVAVFNTGADSLLRQP
jgi:eukaryotic-like serine/threonine-protein kinase